MPEPQPTEAIWLKYLEFNQNVITRMAANSFWLKGWTVTLVAATFALNISTPSALLLLVALLPTIAFWYLDSFFLQQERLFRKLYDYVRADMNRVDFSLNHSAFKSDVDSKATIMWSESLRYFYGTITVLILVAAGLRFWFG